MRRLKEGTAIALVHDRMADGKTAFKKRLGSIFDGPSLLSVAWLSTSRYPRKISQEFPKRNLLRLCSGSGVEEGQTTYCLRTLKICKNQMQQKFTSYEPHAGKENRNKFHAQMEL